MKKISVPRNILFSTLSWFVPLGLTFLITPIVVRGLGHEQYGLYALVQGFIAYSFNFNLGRALTQYISTYHAKGEEERSGEALSATLMVNLVVGVACVVLLALLSGWLVPTLLRIPLPLQQKALLAFYIASLTLLPMMLSYVFNAVPQALQRFDIYSLVTLAGGAFNSISNVVLVWMGYGVLAMLLTNLIGAVVVCILFAVYTRKLLPRARLTLHVPRELLRGIIRYSASVTSYQIMANALLLFERSWITRTLGTEALTFYVIPMSIALYIHAFISSVTLVVFPLASEANARQNGAALTHIYTRALKFIGMIVVFPAVALCVGANPLLLAWMGPEFAVQSAPVLIIHVIVFSTIAIGIIPWQMADGLGAPSFNALLVFSWLAIAVPVMIWLTPVLGIKGAALGRLIGISTVPVHALVVERWALGKNLWGFWGRVGGTLILAGAVAGGVEYAMLRIGLSGWASLAAAVPTGGLAYLACLYLTGFVNRDEQVWLRSFVTRAVAS